MGSQRFCLRWNNHQSNLLSVFDQLLHDEAFVDVTLAVEGQFLRAHKMVLSACSPYFQALFVGHPDKHPIVILKDVPYSDMRSLLDFMYRGEVSVDQDRLTAFLKVAESLRIKGLTEVHEERCDLPEIANSLLNPALPPPPPPNLHRLTQIPPQVIKRHHLPPTPMLNSALTGPKRKRGRPRKLSGSNPGTPNPHINDDQDDIRTNNIGNHLDTEGGQTGQCSPNAHCSPSLTPDPAHCVDNTGSSHTLNESDRSTSQSPLDTKTEPKDELMHDESHFDGENETDEYSLKIEEEPKPSTSGQDVLPSYQSAVQTDGERYSSSGEGRLRLVAAAAVARANELAMAGMPHMGAIGGNGGLTSGIVHDGESDSDSLIVDSMGDVENNNELAEEDDKMMPSALLHEFVEPTRPPPTAATKRRVRRRTSNSDPAEALTEMSVRGLNLFRYASISEGVYKCMECAKADILKTFKNKYSFQRHAFLYHEGHQRKVFPCPVCAKEFSRPDKMKNHMKMVHDCFLPKECMYPPVGYYIPQ
ncbi:zinc finger and BTB domain-containing protein ttk isoform X3 [Rhodnius prolixus]|uniref:zinc finger and BTB domain-containing protein ttk isoform X3 n=1 Tax=Rhodnius prolixus TaxID=13249 RepID=UPI003D18B8C0